MRKMVSSKFLYVAVGYLLLNIVSEKANNNGWGKLYQIKQGGPLYLFVNSDTAFYEKRQADKISYFTDFDTLIRQKEDNIRNGDAVFIGKRGKLIINDSIAILNKFEINRKKQKKLIFLIANNSQIQRWHGYKNADKFVSIGAIVDKMLWPRSGNMAYYKELELDWKNLSHQVYTANLKEFDSTLNAFKSKYSIR